MYLCASNTFRIVEFAFECYESLSNVLNLHSNASNPFRMVRMCMRMLRIPFEQLEFALEWFGSLEWFEVGFESFESISNGLNLVSKAWNQSFRQ